MMLAVALLVLGQLSGVSGTPVRVQCVNCTGGPGGGGWSPDGGNIGYMRMPDAGGLEVYVLNPSTGPGGGGWEPDGGFIGSVYAHHDGGVTAYQGGAWSVTATSAAQGTTGAAVPASAELAGYRDTAGNHRPGLAVDADTSGAAIYTQGVSIVGAAFGSVTPAGVETVPVNGFVGGLLVREVKKTASNPLATAVSCTGTAAALPGSALAYRTSLCVYNNGAATIFLGPSGVTTANGFPLPAGAYYCEDLATQVLYCITAGSTVEARTLEQ